MRMSVGVMFAIDSTGSMRWVHRELCDNIGNILVQFEDEESRLDFPWSAFETIQPTAAIGLNLPILMTKKKKPSIWLAGSTGSKQKVAEETTENLP